MEARGDGLAIFEHSPSRQEPVPIVNMPSYERQALSNGISEIARRIHQALGEPDAHQRCLKELSLLEEMNAAGDGEEELPDRAAKEMERGAEQGEEDMASFVEQEVYAIEKMVLVVEDEPEDIEGDRDKEEAFRKHVCVSSDRWIAFSSDVFPRV